MRGGRYWRGDFNRAPGTGFRLKAGVVQEALISYYKCGVFGSYWIYWRSVAALSLGPRRVAIMILTRSPGR